MEIAVRRTLQRLGSAYALAWVTISMSAGPGSAALVELTGNLSYAGLYIALIYGGGASGAFIGGRAMDRYGRRAPLVVAYLVSALGFALVGIGVDRAALIPFLVGALLFAAATGTVNLTRVAAAEMFPPAERGRGVAWVQISAIFGAVVGPLLLLLSEPLGRLLGRPPLGLVWFLAPPLLLVSAFLVGGAMEPRALAERVAATGGIAPVADTQMESGQGRLLLAGSASLAASQAAMASVMGVAGAAVSHAGHGVRVLGGLMFMHFIGMFALSRLVGRVADRIGRRATIVMGLGLLAAGGATVALVPGAAGFGVGLLLVGFGWSFGFIGATVFLTDVTVPSRRARTLGRADLAAQLASAVVATAGGWWFASRGLAGLGILAIVVVVVPLLLLAKVREGTPGQYSMQSSAVSFRGSEATERSSPSR